MADIKVVVSIDEDRYKSICDGVEAGKRVNVPSLYAHKIIANGTPLPKGHGRIVDIGKIDEDRIDDDNPIIYLTVNGEYTEAVSLDYLNNLPTIIEADRSEENGKNK